MKIYICDGCSSVVNHTYSYVIGFRPFTTEDLYTKSTGEIELCKDCLKKIADSRHVNNIIASIKEICHK